MPATKKGGYGGKKATTPKPMVKKGSGRKK